MGRHERQLKSVGARRPVPGSGRLRKGILASAAALVLLVVGVAVLNRDHGSRGPDHGSSGAGTAGDWQTRLNAVFQPVAQRLPGLARSAEAWHSGATPPEAFSAELESLLPAFIDVASNVARLPDAPSAPRAKGLYLAAARLYVEAVRVERVAVDEPAGDTRDQVHRASARLRVLGDRVYDRGVMNLEPRADDLGDATELVLPEEVPDWAALGLAPGPPLAHLPIGEATFAERQKIRPEQPEPAWRKAVEAADLSSGAEIGQAIRAGKAEDLGHLADRLTGAVTRLWSLPGPEGGRERFAVLSLGAMVKAEAARLAQAASFVEGPDLKDRLGRSARRLALVGDTFYDPVVPAEPSGFDPSLLEDRSLDGRTK